MRIGIDGRLLSGKFTGDRTYWRGLLEGLAEADTVNEYVVYLQSPIEGEPPAVGPNVQFKVIPGPLREQEGRPPGPPSLGGGSDIKPSLWAMPLKKGKQDIFPPELGG